MITKIFQPQPNLTYPLMRDPQQQPKCYEMTEEERLQAVKQIAERLRQRTEKMHNPVEESAQCSPP
jgi:hypothetical protein